VTKRFHYGQVQQFFDDPASIRKEFAPDVLALLERMRELARLLRARRRSRGFLELSMPEAKVEMDPDGRVVGATYAVQDEAHQVIEEFMLTANEAVAQRLHDEGLAFLRRVHEDPDPLKLDAFGEFARSLGLKVEQPRSRFELQRIAAEVRGKPEQPSVHYALLRSMKEAVYSPEELGHYALASPCYCHFTSPIRRYPDLTIHRMLDALIRFGKAGFDRSELIVLGEHCSHAERRAAKAERELVKVKVLHFLEDKEGQEIDALVTGVEEFGLFCQAKTIPAEGLVHVRTLPDDYYVYDSVLHTLTGRKSGNQFRLGMEVKCVIAKVDLDHRQLDLRLAASERGEKRPAAAPPAASRRGAKGKNRPSPPAGRRKRRR
jgi:ribonuclease R